MSQINKYPNRAAYEADDSRLKTQSAVSYVEDDGELIYDGVNVVVGKDAAGVGDLVVFNKTDGTLKFVKETTLLYGQLQPELVPMAVVYARQGERILIVSLKNTKDYTPRWAHPYEVALSGFNLTGGGTFVLHINNADYTFIYAAGATLESIAEIINSNTTVRGYGWRATADAKLNEVIFSCNTAIEANATIEAVSGCALRRTPEDKNYQTTFAGTTSDTGDNIRRKNGVNVNNAGCNPAKFLEYYSANGSTAANTQPGSATIIRRSVFTKADNPALVAMYPTYEDYLFGEHLLQFPSAYGALLRDGRDNTRLIGTMRFIDIYGNLAPCYPAAAEALDYGVTVEGATTGLEAGAWWLPSVEEMYLLMRDRALTEADADSDPVNRTLLRVIGSYHLYASARTFWTPNENWKPYVYVYHGDSGRIAVLEKFRAMNARPVCVL